MFHITPTPTSWMLWAAIYVVAVLVIAFWVWLGTFLLWKILAIVGAGLLIWPAFITMVSGGVLCIVLLFIASVIRD